MVPLNETLDVLGRQLCKPCAEVEVSQHPEGQITAESITRNIDPTVCVQCGADNGELDLPMLANVPVCSSCEGLLRNYPYPKWLKLGFAVLMALAVFCFVRNWRFMAAFREINQLKRALNQHDIEKAADLSDAAARHIPEAPELGAAANLYRGLVLLRDDKSAEALNCFNKAGQNPAAKGLGLVRFTLMAEAGVAFDGKNYDEFLRKQQAISALAPNDSVAVAGLASAYACKYAVTGSDEFRKTALKQLDQAHKLAGPSNQNLQEFNARIHHRLETREIITRQEYLRRFPSGYRTGSKS